MILPFLANPSPLTLRLNFLNLFHIFLAPLPPPKIMIFYGIFMRILSHKANLGSYILKNVRFSHIFIEFHKTGQPPPSPYMS